MWFAVQLVFAAALVLGGITVLPIGFRALRGTLSRNRYVGVRTAATLRSEHAFQLGNRAAAPAVLAAGALSVLSGLALSLLAVSMLASPVSAVVVGVLGLGGGLALLTVGGVLGHRVAAAVGMPTPGPGGCGGACAGCGALCGVGQRS